MKESILILLALGTLSTWSAATLKTPWGEKVTPENAWRDYPRPQMVRANWVNLNGIWDYTITSNTTRWTQDTWKPFEVAKGKILVPFCFESQLSGVQRLIEPHEKMIYTRTITVHPRKGFRTLLNFEAVDWRTQVFINGEEVMDVPNECGHLPFSMDITPFAHEGENELRVVAWDPQGTFPMTGGKQVNQPKGCFYTRVSGIWQTVWMEEVPDAYVKDIKITTTAREPSVTIEAFTTDVRYPATVKILAGERVIASGAAGEKIALPKEIQLWSPDTPTLYNYELTYANDVVKGYFAVREISRAQDVHGSWRFQLNGKFFFPIGTLDQGWWPDGLLTPPSSEACAYDILTLKKLGFNMMRKHIKVEPRVYYYLCDKLGIAVFQDMPSSHEYFSPDRTKKNAHIIFDQARNLQRYGLYRREWKQQMELLRNHPSIIMWIPYNESWGQPDCAYTFDTFRFTRRFDPTRLIGGPSGWNDFEGGKMHDGPTMSPSFMTPEVENPLTDTVDIHPYPGPGQCEQRKHRISMCGEYGGIALRVEGHLWDPSRTWGYGGTGQVTDRAASQKHLLTILNHVIPLVKKGLGTTVYTQTTDVETEINGMMTYDRKVVKYDVEALRAIHEKILQTAYETATQK